MNCGCEDYHMADCPLMSPPSDDPPYEDEDWTPYEDEDWTSMILGA